MSDALPPRLPTVGPWQLVLAGSELAACRVTPAAQASAGASVVLAFAAAHLHQPGGDSGHAPGLRLLLGGAVLDGDIGPGRLRDGRLWQGGRWHAGWAVPGQWLAGAEGPLRLELTGGHGDTLSLRAATLRACFQGPAGDDLPGPAGWQPWLHC